MVGIAEAFALLFAGFLAGIISTFIDVAVLGADAFGMHFALWVLLNALIAIHVDSRVKAIWWAIPFNLGFIEFYYLCTAASFEGYGKALLVPLAAMALVSALLAYALWTAKRDRGPYGKILSVLISAGVVGTGYYLYGDFDLYTIVTAMVLLFILLFWPARRLKFVPAVHPPAGLEEQQVRESSSRRREVTPRGRSTASIPEVEESYEEDDYAWDLPHEEDSLRRNRYDEEPELGRAMRSGRNDRSVDESSQTRKRTTRRTRRRSLSDDVVTTRGSRSRRSVREREENNREAQRRAAVQRRARRERSARNEREDDYYTPTISTLGTVRTVRPSSRSSRTGYGRYSRSNDA